MEQLLEQRRHPGSLTISQNNSFSTENARHSFSFQLFGLRVKDIVNENGCLFWGGDEIELKKIGKLESIHFHIWIGDISRYLPTGPVQFGQNSLIVSKPEQEEAKDLAYPKLQHQAPSGGAFLKLGHCR